MGFYYDGKCYNGNSKTWKYNTRKYKRELKKSSEELSGMLSILALPFLLPFIVMGALFGNKKSKK